MTVPSPPGRVATDERPRERTGRCPALDADPPPENAGDSSSGARRAHRQTADAARERGVREDPPAIPRANHRSRTCLLGGAAGRQADRDRCRPGQAGLRLKVTLLRKNEANAYCLPGGKIVVYTGILPLTRNDAGLATVLGHEV